MSKTTNLIVEIERQGQELIRLRAENAALRKQVLEHNGQAVRCSVCEYLPHDLRLKRGKDRAEATTRTYTHG
jgi:hypothetical protein